MGKGVPPLLQAAVLTRALWPFFVIGGCAFVVFGLDRSAWWFALAFMAAF